MYLIDNIPARDDDYSGYEEVAFYPGIVNESQWLEFPINPPKCGRYFVMQRSAPNDGEHNYLEVAEVELY